MRASDFPAVFLLCGLGCGLLVASANLIFYVRVLPEVNASLAEGQKISRFFVNFKMLEIIRRHAELAPQSKLRILMFTLFGLGIFCAFTGFLFSIVIGPTSR